MKNRKALVYIGIGIVLIVLAIELPHLVNIIAPGM